MTWPFENDTSAITKKLAKKSLQSEKRRNLMVVIAVALAASGCLPHTPTRTHPVLPAACWHWKQNISGIFFDPPILWFYLLGKIKLPFYILPASSGKYADLCFGQKRIAQ